MLCLLVVLVVEKNKHKKSKWLEPLFIAMVSDLSRTEICTFKMSGSPAMEDMEQISVEDMFKEISHFVNNKVENVFR